MRSFDNSLGGSDDSDGSEGLLSEPASFVASVVRGEDVVGWDAKDKVTSDFNDIAVDNEEDAKPNGTGTTTVDRSESAANCKP